MDHTQLKARLVAKPEVLQQRHAMKGLRPARSRNKRVCIYTVSCNVMFRAGFELGKKSRFAKNMNK